MDTKLSILFYSKTSKQTKGGLIFSFISPLCNTDAMNSFLQQLAQHYSTYRIVMLLDKAGGTSIKV